jgi:hypothetical protein
MVYLALRLKVVGSTVVFILVIEAASVVAVTAFLPQADIPVLQSAMSKTILNSFELIIETPNCFLILASESYGPSVYVGKRLNECFKYLLV